MNINAIVLCGVITAALPSAALAEDHDKDFFAGFEVLGGFATGSSSTTNGGGNPPLFAGDGIVHDVAFGGTVGVGGYVGYRLDPNWSVYASYQHIRGGINWSADYPSFGVASDFSSDASSNVLMGNVAYAYNLSDETSLIVKAGLGLSLNRLSGVTETDQASGLFAAELAAHTLVNPAAQIGVGVQQMLAPNVSLGLDASVTYAGSFKTGDTRTGNLSVTAINPYTIENVWRGNLGASLTLSF